jgi:hypothetical protein
MALHHSVFSVRNAVLLSIVALMAFALSADVKLPLRVTMPTGILLAIGAIALAAWNDKREMRVARAMHRTHRPRRR